MKILCVCQGWNCRSVALAWVLKARYGQDAIAAGWQGNSPETIEHLCRWADRIIVVEGNMRGKIPEIYQDKLSIYDVGADRWFPTPFNEELFRTFDAMILEHVAASR